MSEVVQRLKAATPRERALVLAALAIASALLSWGLPEPDIVFLHKTPMLPALWFGLVLCAGAALWSSRNPSTFVIVLVATGAAWLAAFEATVHVYGNIEDRMVSQPGATAPNFSVPAVDYLLGLCGMLGGLIGSTVLVLIISLAMRSTRAVSSWTRTILIGTVAGLFLEFLQNQAQGGLFIHTGSLLPLFLVWQMSVAASLAYGFAKPAAGIGTGQSA